MQVGHARVELGVGRILVRIYLLPPPKLRVGGHNHGRHGVDARRERLGHVAHELGRRAHLLKAVNALPYGHAAQREARVRPDPQLCTQPRAQGGGEGQACHHRGRPPAVPHAPRPRGRSATLTTALAPPRRRPPAAACAASWAADAQRTPAARSYSAASTRPPPSRPCFSRMLRSLAQALGAVRIAAAGGARGVTTKAAASAVGTPGTDRSAPDAGEPPVAEALRTKVRWCGSPSFFFYFFLLRA
jgi:hypothetical protein